MTAAPLVTVLIPTHNRADVLPFAIRSVLAQTMPDFELLVAGDGCSDGTAEAVAAFDDPRTRWFDFPKAPHFGYANRNRALREACGELVAYLGHDDLWLPDHLELLSALFRDPDVELAASRQLFVSPGGSPIRPHVINLEDPVMVERLLKGREGFGPSCVLHRRASLDRYGYWREDIRHAGDWELWVRILRGSGTVPAYCGIPTSLHFVADWRTETRLTRLRNQLHRWDGSVPDELSVAVPAGISEQEAVWRELAADPDGWTARLRRGARIDIDRLARMEYPSSLALLAYHQWRRLVSWPTDPTA